MHIPVEACEEQSHRSVRSRAHGRYKYIDKDLLEDLYVVRQKSTVDIAKQLGVSRGTVAEYMKLHGIERRTPGEAGAMKSKKYEVDPHIFDSIDTPDKAYVLGFILGDGHLQWTDKDCSAKRIHIVLAKQDKDLLVSIARFFGCEDAVRFPEKGKSEGAAWQKRVVLDVTCTRLVDVLRDLHNIPLGPKSGMEPFVDFYDDSLTWAFIRGVFDADEHIRNYLRTTTVKGKTYTNPRCRLTMTVGLRFVDGLVRWLKARGFQLPPKCSHQKGKEGTWEFELASRETLKQIRKYLYADGSLFLERKKAIFDAL